MKKNKGCLTLLILFCFLFVLTGIFSNKQKSKEDKKETKEISGEYEVPVISGSNAYDFVTSLNKYGLKEYERTKIDDGYAFSSQNIGYSYYIQTNNNYEICYAEFWVFEENKSDDNFLEFCSTFNYDSSDPEKAAEWISTNIGSESEINIGDAKFKISKSSVGPVLEIYSDNWKNYLEKSLSEKLLGENP